MIQYAKIEDALFDIVQDNSMEVLDNSKLLIALMSDYAPGLSGMQQLFRKFVRADSNYTLLEALRNKRSRIRMLPQLYEIGLLAGLGGTELQEIVLSMDAFLRRCINEYDLGESGEALHTIGMYYFRRFPREKNIPVALYLLSEAGAKGHAESYLYVANCYLKGKGIPTDISVGMRYLNLASEGGSEKAIVELAERLRTGNGVDEDPDAAIGLLRRIPGHPYAVFLLGEILSENQQSTEAFRCYQNAATMNVAYAQYEIALCYATGRGTKRDMNEAKRWLKVAAASGHSEARKKLEELGEKWT